MEYPKAFLCECRQILADEFPLFERAMQEESERCMRINPKRTYISPFPDMVAWEENGRYVPQSHRPQGDIAHFAGAYYMQDASAMAPVAALCPKNGEYVADLCAAPGGKSGQIAARLKDGFLLSNEYEMKRARMLSGNLERLGVENALVTCADTSKIAKAFPQFFDAVLVDAPCSGEGMFRKDRDAITEWTEEAPIGCHVRQMYILDNAAKIVREGGRIVYSTCTFNRKENEDTIAEFLTMHPEFHAGEFALSGIGKSENGMLRLWPHRIRGEGHFVALLQREGTPKPRQESHIKRDKAAYEAFSLIKKTIDLPFAVDESRLRMNGDVLCLLPKGVSGDLPFPVLRAGLELCRIGKGYAEPMHALAMAMGEKLRSIAVTEDDAKRFIAGETISAQDAKDGWVVVTYNALPLGWGKISGDTVKNHIPKGLRIRS